MKELLRVLVAFLVVGALAWLGVCAWLSATRPRLAFNDAELRAPATWLKEKLVRLYNDYFYRRQEAFWRGQALTKLPVLTSASDMLICGEDLGMVPDCVGPVMQELCLLGLRIQRMPKETGVEFSDPADYPYLTVCTTSSHDMSTIRGWWGEDSARSQRYYKTMLGGKGDAPSTCDERICEENHKAASRVSVDVGGLSRPGHPRHERRAAQAGRSPRGEDQRACRSAPLLEVPAPPAGRKAE